MSFTGTVVAESPDPDTVWDEDYGSDDQIEYVESMAHDESENVILAAGEDPDEKKMLWAIDASDRSIQWSTEIGVTSSLAFNDNSVVVGGDYRIEVVDRSTEQTVDTYEDGDSGHNRFYDFDVDSNYIYIAGDNGNPEILTVDVSGGTVNFETTIDSDPEYDDDFDDDVRSLSADSGELTMASRGTDGGVSILDISTDPTEYELITSEFVSDYDTDYEQYGLERVGDDIYIIESDGSRDYVRAFTNNSDTGVQQAWHEEIRSFTELDETEGDSEMETQIVADDSWVFVDETENLGKLTALNQSDGGLTWSVEDDVTENINFAGAIAAGSDDENVNLYASWWDGSSEHLSAFTDGIIGADSDTTGGTISTTVDSPHPSVGSVELTSTNPGTDIIQEGVGQPRESYNLSVGLDGDLGNVDRVDVELYRVDELGEKTDEDPTANAHYNLSIDFDENGDATVSSVHDSDTHLSTVVVDGIDREVDTDTTTIEITLPEDIRPSANTQDTMVNDYSWEVTSTSVNEDIEEEDNPETVVNSFDVGTLVDATINTGSIEQQESLILPGFEDVAHSPIGEDDAISIEAGGNVEVDIDLSATDLEHETDDSVISVGHTKVLAGDGHTLSDYDHADVTQLSNTPSDVGASPLTNGEFEEFRMWVDYPEDIEPGEYNGEFTFTVVEIGAS